MAANVGGPHGLWLSRDLLSVEDFFGEGIEFADGFHGFERFEVFLNLGPFFRIFFGDDGGLWIGVVRDEIVFELVGDNFIGTLCDHCEEGGVGPVGEGVAARFDDESGIEITVGEVAFDVIEVGQDEAHRLDGAVDALDVEVFGLHGGAFDGEHFDRADLGQYEDKTGVEMAGEAGVLAVGLPVVVSGCLKEIVSEVVEIGAGRVGGKVLFMEDGFGSRDVGKEAADGVAVDADGGLFGADDVGQVESVGLEERLAQKRPGHFEADVLEVSGRGEATLAELVDVEGELGLDVGVRVLSVVDGGAVFFLEFGKFDRDGEIDGGAVADGVADVMREGADGEGELVGGVRVAEEADDEVSGADVVGEVGEEFVAEGVVAEVLDGAAAVGVGVSLLELGFGEGGIVLEKNGPDGLLPGQIDQLLVSLDGVGDGWRCREKQPEGGYCLKEGGAAGGRDRLSSSWSVSTLHTVHRMKGMGKG